MKTFQSKHRSALWLLATSLALFSCQKEESNQKSTGGTPELTATPATYSWVSSAGCDAANPLNPYDVDGYNHNVYVQALEGAYVAQNSTQDVYMEISANASAYFNDPQLDPFCSPAAIQGVIDILSTADGVDNYIQSMAIPADQKQELQNLMTILNQYDGSNLCDVLNQIRSFEDNILQHGPAASSQMVLSASAVGRYSLVYWDDEVSAYLLNNPGGGPAIYNDAGMVIPWRKGGTVLADVLGGIVGGASGGPTVIGNVVGAIVGASAASVAFDKLWDLYD